LVGVMFAAQVVGTNVCPNDKPAKATPIAATPKIFVLKSDILSPCEFCFLESVEVLCNLSLNYNGISLH
jgi:hypothetical protein